MATPDANLKSFKLQIKGLKDLVDENADALVQAVALQVLASVVELSPVDTGAYKGNWQVGNARPKTGVLKRLDKPGTRTLSSGTQTITRQQPGQSIFISNNVHYATYLEFGTEHMDARYILKRSLMRVSSHFKRRRPTKLLARSRRRRR